VDPGESSGRAYQIAQPATAEPNPIMTNAAAQPAATLAADT
jgi:hypothetical protein